ncbi:hypothetical protein CHLRE_14g614400v5 [Chlamydomonas reinhardtii]|uniref:Uncharacterized protein n=1 Tax=Chlamydomonas reinhardtii TaxID=3055 RepID=A0A2K3CXG7_CHLRE|nr:uncharacterized protein CHLRE_14g614400v5 [Chlamydomonas reinhardtii]PNW72987.1 hypothetical protein CHLRE_14g614400v5 [Chlamydomonas reinhardtii]
MAQQPKGAGPSRGLQPADLTQDDDDAEEAPDTAVLLASFRTKVVGVRYYDGEANTDEMVLLIREPNNTYDRWAIRVDNIRGDKIGHISREQAAVLSPLIDAGQLRIEGVVQGAKGQYNMPIDLLAFTPPEAADAVRQQLLNGGIRLGRAAAGSWAGGGAGGAAGGAAAGGARASIRVLTPTEVDCALDKLFDEVHSTAAMQPSMHPDPEVLSRLFPHQRVALAWMVARENDSTSLPPFWEQVPGTAPRFRSTLTNFVGARRPAAVRGGILADDMGLGKTLTVISLIATNRPGLKELPPVTPLSLADPDPDEPPTHTAAAGAGAGPSASAVPAEAAAGKSKARGGKAAAAEKGKDVQAAKAEAQAKAKAKAKAVRGGKRRRKAEAGSDEEAAKQAEEPQEEAAEEVAAAGEAGQEEEEVDDDAALGDADEEDGSDWDEEDGADGDEEEQGRGAPAGHAVGPSAAGPSAAGPSAAAPSTGGAAAAAATAGGAGGGAPPHAGGPRGTLIVCPVSVMSNWALQLQEHTAGNLKVYQYHGPERSSSPAVLCAQDVVLTSYAVLGRELDGAGGRGGLLGVRWLRVVLDEAHLVKNPRAKASRAAAQLQAERRWAVTGTPIQNRMQDLHGLLVFLRVDPLQDRSLFTRTIERPLKQGDPRAVKTVQVLMGALALRRTKDLRVGPAGRPLVALPSKTVRLVTVDLTPEDRAKYDALELEARRIISHALATDELLDHYISVLEIILRLRQVADAGCLCGRDPLPLSDIFNAAARRQGRRGRRGGGAAAALSEAERKALVELLVQGLQAQDSCSICLDDFTKNACITRCKHMYCKPCIERLLTRSPDAGCPLCRGYLALAELVDLPPEAAAAAEGGADTQAGSDVADPVAASAKVAALMAALRQQQQQAVAAGGSSSSGAGAGAPPAKAVVFSQFTGMLNLVGRALEAEGISYVRLDGSTPAKARAERLRRFASREPGSPLVFLSSLKAGGVGMNLTAASAVHLMDPWWNPAVEEQAMDRVHRLGQTRDVEVFRYVAANTIEERMLQLQERKRQLASAAFDRSAAESGRMRIDDVRLLMGLEPGSQLELELRVQRYQEMEVELWLGS